MASTGNKNDPTQPETWPEWGEADLDRMMRHVASLSPYEADRWIRNRIGYLLNRAIKAEADRKAWRNVAERWRERYENTAEGRAKKPHEPTQDGWTASDVAGSATRSE